MLGLTPRMVLSRIVAVISVILLSACASEVLKESDPNVPIPPIDASKNAHLRRFLSADFQLVHRTRQIDPAVLPLLRSKLRSDPRLAEPNEIFQGSDVMDPRNLPRRQFVLGGYVPGFWFIDYLQGGFAPCHHLILFSRMNTGWEIVFAGDLFLKQRTLAGIRSAVRSGRLLPQTNRDDF
jgi:hypothetical protein